MSGLINVISFLIHIVITLYIYAVIIRMILGLAGTDIYNPFSQFIMAITNPALLPLRKLIPSIRRIDTAAVLLILFLKFLELFTRSYLVSKQVVLGALIIPTILGAINLVINLFIFSIIILVIISWIAPYIQSQNNPLVSILRTITEPLLRPARKYIPPVGMFDLSPLVVLIALYCVQIFLNS